MQIYDQLVQACRVVGGHGTMKIEYDTTFVDQTHYLIYDATDGRGVFDSNVLGF